MVAKTKIVDVPVTVDEGLLLVVAEILRHDRKQQERDYQEARLVIRQALKRLNGQRVS